LDQHRLGVVEVLAQHETEIGGIEGHRGVRKYASCSVLSSAGEVAVHSLPHVATRPASRRPTRRARRPTTLGGRVRVLLRPPGAGWARYVLAAGAVAGVVGIAIFISLWSSYGQIIDARLSGAEQPVPRIFGRAFELRPGVGLSLAQLVQRLN